MIGPEDYKDMLHESKLARKKDISEYYEKLLQRYAKQREDEPFEMPLYFREGYNGECRVDFTEDEIDFAIDLLRGWGWYVSPGVSRRAWDGPFLMVFFEEPAPTTREIKVPAHRRILKKWFSTE